MTAASFCVVLCNIFVFHSAVNTPILLIPILQNETFFRENYCTVPKKAVPLHRISKYPLFFVPNEAYWTDG